MNARRLPPVSILALFTTMVLAGCGPGQFLGPTVTPTLTETLSPSPTNTAIPSLTPTEEPTQSATPTPITITATSLPRAQLDGIWTGISNQGGGVQLEVKSGHITHFIIELKQTGCESFTPLDAYFNQPEPIIGNTFTLDLLGLATVSGNISRNGVLAGTMSYNIANCQGKLAFTAKK